jgi:signal transduction histidine kinase
MNALIARMTRRYLEVLKLEHLPVLIRARARIVVVINILALSVTGMCFPLILLHESYAGIRLPNIILGAGIMILLGLNAKVAQRGHVDISIQIVNLLTVMGVTANVVIAEELEPRIWAFVLTGVMSFFATRPMHVVLMASNVIVCGIICQSLLMGTVPEEFLRDEMARVIMSTLMIMLLAYLKTRTHVELSDKLLHNHQIEQLAVTQAEHHHAELMDLLDHARQTDRLKSRFLADMSHELRTPLSAILGYTELIHEDIGEHTGLPDTVHADAEMIQIASHHLLSLIDEVLDLDDIEQGELRFRPLLFDLIEVVSEVVVAMSHASQGRGNKLLFTHALPTLTIRQDPTLVRQLLFNFVSNAIKFTEHGLIEIELLHTTSMGARLRITDTGLGMNAQDLKAIREEFAQASAQRIKQYGGTGLGLPLCYAIVEKMGGDLEIQSTPGAGTIIILTMPSVAIEGEP